MITSKNIRCSLWYIRFAGANNSREPCYNRNMKTYTLKKKLKEQGRILPDASYGTYDVLNGGGKTNVRVSYFKCCSCKKNNLNIASLVKGVEYGIHQFADLLFCDKHFYGFFEELQGEV